MLYDRNWIENASNEALIKKSEELYLAVKEKLTDTQLNKLIDLLEVERELTIREEL